jgi:MASE1
MDAHAWKTVGRGLAIGAAYCAAFSILWRYSVDQWYLPAGLRLASLLLLPMRYWPYVFAGDAAAMLNIRAPKAEQYSPQWAYLSPFLLVMLISAVPLYVRKKLSTREHIVKWLPLIALVGCIWSTVAGRLINIVLQGPTPPFTVERFIGFCVGDFLGILMVLLPCLLWQQRNQWRNTRTHIMQSLAIAVLMVAALFGAAMIPAKVGTEIRLLPLVFMLLPLVYLTTLHGWHGAAVGTLLVNVAISLALPQIHSIGTADPVVLIAQTALAATSGGLLAIGIRVSSLHERSGESLRSELLSIQLQQQQNRETETMGAVRSMVQSFEQQFREKSLLLAYARDDLDAYRNAVAQTLKDEGLYQQAMDAISAGVESSRALVRHSERLYPVEIETYGLHAVLLSEYFQDRWSGRIHLQCTVPSPSSSKRPPLSLPLQLVAYRAICSGMDLLASMEPTEYILRMRQWRRGGRKGLTVFIDCSPTTTFALTSNAQQALQELAMLARAYDGTFQHRHTHRIGFLVSEPQLMP